MNHVQPSSRRQFLRLSGLAGAASILPGCSMAANTEAMPVGKAKNVIYLMVDGLCNGTVGLAHHWQLRHKGTPLNWMQLFEHEGQDADAVFVPDHEGRGGGLVAVEVHAVRDHPVLFVAARDPERLRRDGVLGLLGGGPDVMRPVHPVQLGEGV